MKIQLIFHSFYKRTVLLLNVYLTISIRTFLYEDFRKIIRSSFKRAGKGLATGFIVYARRKAIAKETSGLETNCIAKIKAIIKLLSVFKH